MNKEFSKQIQSNQSNQSSTRYFLQEKITRTLKQGHDQQHSKNRFDQFSKARDKSPHSTITQDLFTIHTTAPEQPVPYEENNELIDGNKFYLESQLQMLRDTTCNLDSFACDNTLLRNRKLLVKNINALSGIDNQKIQKMKIQQIRGPRIIKQKKCATASGHSREKSLSSQNNFEFFSNRKTKIDLQTQLAISEELERQRQLNYKKKRLPLDKTQQKLKRALVQSKLQNSFDLIGTEIKDYIKERFNAEKEIQKLESMQKIQAQIERDSQQKIVYFNNVKFKLPKDITQKYQSKLYKVSQEQKQELIAYILDQFPQLVSEFQKGNYDYYLAMEEKTLKEDKYYILFMHGRNVPISKCCCMPISIKFTKNSGVKYFCLDTLCPFNPLKQEIIPQKLQQKLFNTGSCLQSQRQMETQRENNDKYPAFSTTHTAYFNNQLSQRFSNRNLSQTQKSSLQQPKTSSMSSLLLRPPSQKYMQVARNLRGGRHKQISLREAMIRDQQSNNSMIKQAYNCFRTKASVMNKTVGQGFKQINHHQTTTTANQPKTTRDQINTSQWEEVIQQAEQTKLMIKQATEQSQLQDTIKNALNNSSGLPGQHAAVGTVIGYTQTELNKIQSQLWSNKSGSLQNRKALTKLTDTKGNLNVKVHKSVFDNQRIGRYNKNRVSQDGFDDSAINKILFDISKNKRFM